MEEAVDVDECLLGLDRDPQNGVVYGIGRAEYELDSLVRSCCDRFELGGRALEGVDGTRVYVVVEGHRLVFPTGLGHFLLDRLHISLEAIETCSDALEFLRDLAFLAEVL